MTNDPSMMASPSQQDFPDAHLLQTPGWAALKSTFGWRAQVVLGEHTRAQVLLRRLAPGLTLAYIPRGPGGEALKQLLPELDNLCRREAAFALKVEPDLPWSKAASENLEAAGFQASEHPIQPPRSILVDLEDEEEMVLARMKQKTRYNIRLAERRGVVVQPWDDIAGFARMMEETGARDGFGAHSQAYYQRAYDIFHPQGACALLVAQVEGYPVASIMIFRHGSRAWYLYGASRDRHREKMPTYLLQWEAMRWAKRHGCSQYDLWGIPDAEPENLEQEFAERSDGLWGVYRFKRGFGGEVVRSLGAWDRIYKPVHYAFYKFVFQFLRRGVG